MEVKDKLSIEDLRDAGSVQKAIYLSTSKYLSYPEKLIKPVLRDNKSLAAAKEYFEKMDEYHTKQQKYSEEFNAVRNHNNEVDALVLFYIKEDSGLFNIPKEYQEKVYERAYSEGHSGGLMEIYNHLCDLVDIFN